MKSKILIAVMAATVSFSLFGCTQSKKAFIRSIEQSANKAITTTNQTITLSATTDFAWDKLFIFGPYTSIQKINTQLGYDWKEAEKTGIDFSDTIYLLVFTKDRKVVFYAELPRAIGDFKGLEIQNEFAYGKDQFRVVSTNIDNSRRFIFFPKTASP